MKQYSAQEITDFCMFIREQATNYITPSNCNQLVEAALSCLGRQFEAGEVINNADIAQQYFTLKLAYEKNEVFVVLFLDSQNRAIKFEKLFVGSISHCLVHPRVIVQRALELNAAGVILGHNHPSGNSIPSDQDIILTENLKEILKILDVKLVDHIVVSNSSATSMAKISVI